VQLPNRAKAYIRSGKLTAYLLAETHAVGKSKAKFFRGVGFDDTNVEQLEQQLLLIAQTERVEEVFTSPHGAKYVIDGSMTTPKARIVRVRTVWIIEPGQETPRFVTAYPID